MEEGKTKNKIDTNFVARWKYTGMEGKETADKMAVLPYITSCFEFAWINRIIQGVS